MRRGAVQDHSTAQEEVLRQIMRKLDDIDLSLRGSTAQAEWGGWLSRTPGEGLEFEKITRYDLGEDPRRINWQVTARLAGGVVKNVFREERALSLLLLVDVSPSMDFGSRRVMKRHLAAEVAAVLAYSAVRSGGKVGLSTWGGWPVVRLPGRRSRDYPRLIVSALLGVGPGTKYEVRGAKYEVEGRSHAARRTSHIALRTSHVAHRTSHWDERVPPPAAQLLGLLPARRALVCLISDFLDDLGTLETFIKQASLQHDLVCAVIRDPREEELPPGRGLLRLRDVESGAERWVWLGEAARQALRHEAQGRDRELRRIFADHGVDSLWLGPGSDLKRDLVGLFVSRRRRSLSPPRREGVIP